MTNMYSYICIKCMIYDLLLNCKNTTARTNDKTGTVMAIGFLKEKKTQPNCSKIIKNVFTQL